MSIIPYLWDRACRTHRRDHRKKRPGGDYLLACKLALVMWSAACTEEVRP